MGRGISGGQAAKLRPEARETSHGCKGLAWTPWGTTRTPLRTRAPRTMAVLGTRRMLSPHSYPVMYARPPTLG